MRGELEVIHIIGFLENESSTTNFAETQKSINYRDDWYFSNSRPNRRLQRGARGLNPAHNGV